MAPFRPPSKPPLAILALACLTSAPLIPVPCAAQGPTCPEPGTAAASEACVRQELGIPPDAQRVAIVSQSSHLDWDWRHTFETYFAGPLMDSFLFLFPGPVDTILSDATDLMTHAGAANAHYYYSIAEIGYLARFLAAHPELAGPLRAVGHDLRIVGGGITSPDNLLPPGESFIRDYLVGKTWLDGALGLPIRQAWLPDDFGHDSQLPIVLEAMGLDAVGFGRVPGVDTSLSSLGLAPPAPGSIAEELLRDGLDFTWRADDGSTALAHWMPGGYCQGDWAFGPTPGAESTDALGRLIATDGAASRTPYIFIPVGCDFARPRPAVPDLVDSWNAHEYQQSGVWAAAASFDHYVQLVMAHRAALPTRRFDPTPYWTGFYATRPLLKSMHLRAVQALLAAETFGAIADAAERADPARWLARVQARTAAIHESWETLVPANHHDFITGTALDPVYEDEQLPRLAAALASGEAERTRACTQIADRIQPRADGEDGDVVVFNPLGFPRQGLVEASGSAPARSTDVPSQGLEQASAEGGRLFLARVPSLGYATEDLAREPEAATGRVSLALQADGTAVLENDLLRATLRQDTGWGITSLIDKQSGAEVIAAGQVGNALVPYSDQGGLYRFGSEMPGCSLEPLSADVGGSSATVLERGPLRARLMAEAVVGGRTFGREYQLVAGEPFLRMIATGSAAPGTSVMVQFPLAGPIDNLIHGTAYHWDQKRPARAGPLTFEATHDFLVPEFQGSARAAIFHAGAPAWAVRRDGLLIGALWRNANREQCDFYGAEGSDPHDVAVSYAVRVPTGVRSPRTGEQLREALAFTTPLFAVAGRPAGDLPRVFSLASAAPRRAIITAAKAGTEDPDALVLRVYQPTNLPLRVVIRTRARRLFPEQRELAVSGMTALETALSPDRAGALRIEGRASRFTVLTQRALTTIAVRAVDAR
jgi:alpha-mannosidase